MYRRLAAATELSDVDTLQQDTENSFGALPLAGRLFDRARVRIRATQRLGATSSGLTNGRLRYIWVLRNSSRASPLKLKGRGAIVYQRRINWRIGSVEMKNNC